MPEAPLERRAGLPVAGRATAATAAFLHCLLSTCPFYLPFLLSLSTCLLSTCPFYLPLGTLLLFLGDLLHCVLHPPPPPLASAPTEAVPRRTLLVNIWPCQPPGAAHIPLPSLPPLAPHPAEPAAVAAIAAASSPLVLTLASPAPFERHLEAWRQQTLPVMPPAAANPKTLSLGPGPSPSLSPSLSPSPFRQFFDPSRDSRAIKILFLFLQYFLICFRTCFIKQSRKISFDI